MQDARPGYDQGCHFGGVYYKLSFSGHLHVFLDGTAWLQRAGATTWRPLPRTELERALPCRSGIVGPIMQCIEALLVVRDVSMFRIILLQRRSPAFLAGFYVMRDPCVP